MDTFMYGFWGEGHTWPFADNPFPDYATAERTWMHMLDVQREYWNKTHLVTNTQSDFSVVGDAEMLDRSIRTHKLFCSECRARIRAIGFRSPPAARAIITSYPTPVSGFHTAISAAGKNPPSMVRLLNPGL